jgi:hypothetical protein
LVLSSVLLVKEFAAFPAMLAALAKSRTEIASEQEPTLPQEDPEELPLEEKPLVLPLDEMPEVLPEELPMLPLVLPEELPMLPLVLPAELPMLPLVLPAELPLPVGMMMVYPPPFQVK